MRFHEGVARTARGGAAVDPALTEAGETRPGAGVAAPLGEARPGAGVAAPLVGLDGADRDVRRRRPAALSFLLRWETVRRLGRVISLLALDFAGVYAAIFTALTLKAALHDRFALGPALHGTRQIVPFAYLITALLFA